ncbi:DUF1800 domain-containing protein [Roseiterribacter gracilis]|uniref:DUF1800 domain-containing protein n=1 Tax=Roseiterribacter gracilis TaxID=2812848 RepID=A0A8S8XEI7_9PROT|nr:hypothetical protein TMPK1_26190 [Rhodospirillales bacterium TMPK1]
MTSKLATIAAVRFGLGPRPGELAKIGNDPRGWLKQQLRPVTMRIASADGATRLDEYYEARGKGADEVAKMLRGQTREQFRDEAAKRTLAAVTSETPFLERWVQFWSNHFTVSVQRPVVLGLVVPFEDEAIRPYALGKFRDMLLAVARHPAMLLYLDNAASVGPNSRAGIRRERGLNENFARELLELHTLGVNGGYTQNDVRELAKILTGWTIPPRAARMGPLLAAGGEKAAFRFVPNVHEPGDKQLLGATIRESGEREGLEALLFLSQHPATANFIATKLVRHFVADTPPQSSVLAVAKVFRDTDGDLAAVAQALIDLPAAWDPPLSKVKTPNELVISALRGIGATESPDVLRGAAGSLQQLGQFPFTAPSPAGWSDESSSWIGPEAALLRVEWGLAFGTRAARVTEPGVLLANTIAPLASKPTSFQIEHAPSAAEAIALLVASPEFQRR